MSVSVTPPPERSEVINAGRQLLMICVHKVFLLVNMLIMSAKMLPVLSGRGRQTYRSENVQTVTGILLPTAVRPAPFFLFYIVRFLALWVGIPVPVK